ncbi:peroxidase 55 [Prunus yedoensis var. nudiflora]|uniref:Peroxidase n=1 Tax=Prunus yedoensis var. nudiflora TaxID=2094558 RepID=A0A314XPV2_PRUYE|nr:peroxidase 55 [Prunus yedoensis var. nudiflora]
MEACKGLLLVLVLMVMQGRESEGQLAENFYSFTCPNVEFIVKQAVSTKLSQTPITIPATLRLFFHDCFVEGCDASVMIASANGDAEKDSTDNLSLAGDGFDTVIKAKQAVEALCPGVVSCADILALAARDCVVLAGGTAFSVELGRRDGLVSQASRVAGNLPEPNFNLDQLNTMLFALRSLFRPLYNFSSNSPVDPSLDPGYAKQLMGACPINADPVVNLDPETPDTFDNAYYRNLPTVIDFANNPGNFNGAFITAMRKLGRVGFKTGDQGEIRKDCTTFNS